MTGQRIGTLALVIVCVVYAVVLGGWFLATSPEPAPDATPIPTATTAPPTYTPAPRRWQGLIPTPTAGPTPGLLQPPFTLPPEPTAMP